MAQSLVEQLRATLEAIERFDQAIAERAQNHRDFALFDALPGAGPALAPRLLVAFGEQRERYGSAAAVQTYAGIAPVMERSGKQSWVHWRYQCPKFLRQTFVEWASESIRFSFWARAYYQQQRDKGAVHQVAVSANLLYGFGHVNLQIRVVIIAQYFARLVSRGHKERRQ